jgi:hypothetical protein
MDGNVNQQCKSDPFSVSVPECRPPVALKDGETLSGKGGSAATRPFNMMYTAALIPLDKGSAYGEYKCTDTPRKKLKVCKKYIAAGPLLTKDLEIDLAKPADAEKGRALEFPNVRAGAGVGACVPADPAGVSASVCRPPVDETSGGDGGCTATALTAIGVYPSTSAAVRALDAEIAPHHQKLCRERGECAESEAGIRGEQWHQEAVKRAVVVAGWHFKTLPINPTQPVCVNLKTALASGSYLVVGVTNNLWYKGKKKQPLKYPDWPADAPAADTTGWVHSIAIVDGHVCDFQTRQPLSALWLESNNQPQPRKGYMRTIRKVWKLHRCSRTGTGCKGACIGLGA